MADNLSYFPPATTRYFVFALLGLLLSGCDSGIVVHDQDRAGELIVDFLSAIKSSEGIQLAYDWTDDRYKEEITFGEFSSIVASLRRQNQGVDIRLNGYEVFGPVEVIVVYARSQPLGGSIYYRFVLVGTKVKDYYLLDLAVDDRAFEKQGIYRDYQQAIVVQGV